MAFENKPGQGAMFVNDQKEKDTHPDYRGQIKLPDGTDCWISGWLKEGSKGDFISISVKPKDQQSAPKSGFPKAREKQPEANFPDDDIPF
jgi:hypothetical protein